MKMRKEFIIKGFVIVFSLAGLFVLPCMSFATSFSDIGTGNSDNPSDSIQQLSLDSRGFIGYDNNSALNLRRHHGSKNNPTPIPPAAWLFGTGLVGLFGIRRRMLRKKVVDRNAKSNCP